MGMTLHRAERAEVLVDALARVLADPLPDPFAPEVVAVPAKGVERWLTQRLSTRLGVAANVAFPSPTRLVDETLAAVGGFEADDDPWAPQRVLWRLLELIDSAVGEPWCAVLTAHLEGEHRVGRRYAAAEHLRELFRAYEAHRPAMLLAWAAGDDSGVEPDLRWQAELWRRLRTALDHPSPAERLTDSCALVAADPTVLSLPPRLSVFGATRLTTAQRQVLRAISAQREVHLWLAHPSPALWDRLAGQPAVRRGDDRTALLVQHPLTAALSRDVRELQALLADVATVHHRAEHRTGTLLAEVQAAVREDRSPTRRATADGTVQVHACHGPPRQVEVLREALLRLFADDPTLEPRDVLVMCPDVETYAPLVRAAFGQPGAAGHPGHGLRVRLADRSLQQTNPLLDTLSGLLELAHGRVTASQVLDLAATPPVRRRFGFDDDALERLRAWTATTGVRWGIGAQQRGAYGLQHLGQGTWTAGLDRLLLGVAADETGLDWLGLALPLDDVDSSDVALAGQLAELVDRLDHVLIRLQGPQPLGVWVSALDEALELLTDVSAGDAWQLAQARRELADAAEHGEHAQLRLADLRVLLRGRLAGRPTRANFRTGALTVCTMVPMRSVPHRVVALLGLDDGVFPRAGAVDGDDVLQRDPQPGERDPRTEDRQLLLDAVMSAGEHLLLLYTGADPVSGATRPPAVPLGELLDVVRATAGADVVRRHPLQPFDRRDFEAPAFSFDRAALAGARAAAGPRTPPRALVTAALPAVRDASVELVRLTAYLVHPSRAFLSQRLGVRVPDDDDALLDALRAELDPLDKWAIGDRMLQARLDGVDPSDFAQAELRRGTLPPGPIALRLLDELRGGVEELAAQVAPLRTGIVRRLDVSVHVDGDRRLTGTVTGVHDGVLVRATWSKLAAKHRLTAWAGLLASGCPSAVTVGRGSFRGTARSTLTLPAQAAEVLADLVALRDEGLREPLPIATGASCAYALRRAAGDTVDEALAAARKAWDGMFGDRTDSAVRYALGDGFEALTRDGDDGPEGTRFGALARRLWDPLLAAES